VVIYLFVVHIAGLYRIISILFVSVINDEDLLKMLDLPVLVVLDEAYVEFSSLQSRMTWVKKHDNLIVLRTFSKRAGV
jgi:histidinol-phosphate aminotransferase